MLLASDWTALWITLKLAALTTVIRMIVGVPRAGWLAFTRTRAKVVVEALVALPLVLPPTVLGFYLLVMLAPDGPVGRLVGALGGPTLVFSFAGLVIGSVLYSLPFAVPPLQGAFGAMGRVPLEAASTLRAGWWDRLFTVALPLCRRGVLTAVTLSFAHTVGEFGVVLMIGGNIPGQTQVVSIAIYEHVESLEYTQAHVLSAGMLAFSFALLLAIYGLNRRSSPSSPYRALPVSPSLRTSACPPAASPRSLASPARARPPCCGASPAWRGPTGAFCASAMRCGRRTHAACSCPPTADRSATCSSRPPCSIT